MKIGYLGPRGTFSQQAAELYAKGKETELIMHASIPELITAAQDKKIDEAVVPVENSIEGSVNVTLDMLAWDVDLKIKNEISIPIAHNLMVKDNENIYKILSHPQAIGQCRKFLNDNYPNAQIEFTYSTAQAAEIVAQGEANTAAIAAEKAANEYGLNIIHSSIEDNGNNVTRFIVLADHDEKYECDKVSSIRTSMVFSTEDKPGSLYRVLQILNLWDINMTKIESRPSKDILGKYIFFVDIEGHYQNEDIKDAITMIKRKTSFFKMLGSYSPII